MPAISHTCLADDVGYKLDFSEARLEDRITILSGILHAADLAASTKPWELCKEWATRILSEFFVQVS